MKTGTQDPAPNTEHPAPSTPIRIANGQGFWGDWLEAPVRLVDDGPIDYLTLDYLAEVTMSILQKQRQAGPRTRLCARFPSADRPHRRQTPRDATSRSSPMLAE